MKKLEEDLKISAAILSLGLSLVRPNLDQDKKNGNQQVTVSNTIAGESTDEEHVEFPGNGEYINEGKTKVLNIDCDENIQKSYKKNQERSGKEKLNHTEWSGRKNYRRKTKNKNLNILSKKSSKNYFKLFREYYKMENEVTSKLYDDRKYKKRIDLKKEIINKVQQTAKEKIKSNKTFGEEHEEEKKQKFIKYAKELFSSIKSKELCNTKLSKSSEQDQDLKKKIKLDFDDITQFKLYEKVLRDFDREKLQKCDEGSLFKTEVDTEFEKNLHNGVKHELLNKKQPISEGIKIKIDPEDQNELKNKNISGEIKGSHKQLIENNEEDENIQLQLEIEVEPKLQQQGNINLQLFIHLQDDSESQNDLLDKFEEELREKQRMSGIEIKVINCVQVNPELQQEPCEKIQKEFYGEKIKSTGDDQLESVVNSQQNLNLRREMCNDSQDRTLLSNESKIQITLNKNMESSKEKKEVSIDMLQTIGDKKQVHSDTEQNLSGKIENLYEKAKGKFQDKKLEIDIDEQLTNDEIQKKIDELLRKSRSLEQEIDEESEKKIMEEIYKVSTPESHEKMLKQVYLAFEQIITPIEERVKQICEEYFPNHFVFKDDKKQFEEIIQDFKKTFVVKDDEVQIELEKKLPTDSDLDCNIIKNNTQEILNDEVGEESLIELKRECKEKKLDFYCQREIQEKLDNAKRDKLDNEIQPDYDLALEKIVIEGQKKDSNLDIESTIQEIYDESLQNDLECKSDEVQEYSKRESDEEDSYIDVEGFDEDEIQQELDIQPVPEFMEESLQESKEKNVTEAKFVRMNLVTEEVHDYYMQILKRSAPVEKCSASVKLSTPVKVLNSVDELNTEEKRINENELDFRKETNGHDCVKMRQELKQFTENIQDFDEIPPELKIDQEKIDFKLQHQFRKFQEDFYKTFKQEYNKGNKICSSNLFTFNEQQQTFYELKDEFYKIKDDYKSFVLKKFFEDLKHKICEENILDIKKCPGESSDYPMPQIDDHIEIEFAKIELDCYGMEPEFKHNVPLDFESDKSSKNCKKKKFKKEPFDLFEKLHSIHQKKLCEFAKSTTWPENCLYPSGLLDHLFEDPSEDKPNVIVITLYPIDIGYSLKISMDINEPPAEIYFDYATDTVLEYIEREKLPPNLLDLFDRAKPNIFYSGCVIAEIHDLAEITNRRVSRILLRPSNESILMDLNRIIADNSSIDWTYERKLYLESELIKLSNPVLCSDTLPVAGLTVQFQQQLLSGRNISLNPLNHVWENDNSNEDMSSNESKREYFNDSSNEDVHKILWKFDFRHDFKKIIRLYILQSIELQDISVLLCMKTELEFDVDMRFKINLETNQLKLYTSMILEILKQRIDPDVSMFRRYKSYGKSTSRYVTCVTPLFNEKMYEPSHSDISEIINTLLEIKSKIENDKIKSSTESMQSDDNTQ